MNDGELVLALQEEIRAALDGTIPEVQDVHLSFNPASLTSDEAQGQLPAIGIAHVSLQRVPSQSPGGRMMGNRRYTGQAAFEVMTQVRNETSVGDARNSAITIAGKVNSIVDYLKSATDNSGRFTFRSWTIVVTESGSLVTVVSTFVIDGMFGGA